MILTKLGLLKTPVFLHLAPALLLVVAGVQRYLAYAKNLNSWKGGGFGMFASIEDHRNRVLVLYFIDSEGREKRMPVHPGQRIYREYTVLPTERRLKRLVRRLLRENSENPAKEVRAEVWEYQFDPETRQYKCSRLAQASQRAS